MMKTKSKIKKERATMRLNLLATGWTTGYKQYDEEIIDDSLDFLSKYFKTKK